MSDNREKLILEAYRRSDERLAAQSSLALAADGRAMSFAGVMIASSTILAGMSLTSQYMVGVLAASACLLVSACAAAWSAMPVKFAVPGNEYIDWQDDLTGDVAYLAAIESILVAQDEHIADNDTTLDWNAKLLKFSFALAVCSPLSGALAIWVS